MFSNLSCFPQCAMSMTSHQLTGCFFARYLLCFVVAALFIIPVYVCVRCLQAIVCVCVLFKFSIITYICSLIIFSVMMVIMDAGWMLKTFCFEQWRERFLWCSCQYWPVFTELFSFSFIPSFYAAYSMVTHYNWKNTFFLNKLCDTLVQNIDSVRILEKNRTTPFQ